MKRYVSLLIIFSISLCCVPVIAATNMVYCTPQSSNGLTIVNENVLENTIISGESSHVYAAKEGTIIYFDIDDNIICGNKDYRNVDICITYRDSHGKSFSLQYDALDNNKKEYYNHIEIYKTSQIKTVDIRLQDANFKNRLSGSDFSIAVSGTNENSYLYIYKVEVKIDDTLAGITATQFSQTPGNIFFDGMNCKFYIEYSNLHNFDCDMDVSYQVEHCESNSMFLETARQLNIRAKGKCTDSYSINDAKDYGTYILHLKIKCSEHKIDVGYDIPFSVCVNALQSGVDEKIGICGHFNWGRESANGMKIIKNAGFGNLREGYDWEAFEKSFGVYKQPEKFTEYIKNSEKNGLNTLVMVGFNNTALFDDVSNFKIIPQTDEQRKAFADYVYKMLEINRGKIGCVEVWNEPNLDSFNFNNVGASVYAKLLKAVYDRIRNDFPDVKIAAPALAKVFSDEGRAWFEEFLSTDLDGDGAYDVYKYFDVATFHHYSTDYETVVDELKKLNSLMETYGCADKEVYYTEFGSDGKSEEGKNAAETDRLQASKLARYYLTLRSADIADKFFVYDFSNDGFRDNYYEHNLGITESEKYPVAYAAKSALLAVANINNLVSDTDSVSFLSSDDVKIASFENLKRKTKVYAFYTNSDSEYEYFFENDGKSVDFFDIYGNKLEFTETEGLYSISVSQAPIYARVSYSDDNEIRVYRNGKKEVRVCGTLHKAEAGDMIGIKVFDENGSMVYITQDELDEFLNFDFSFEIPVFSKKYYLDIGTESFNKIYNMEVDTSYIFCASLKAYSGMSEITDMNHFVISPNAVIKSELGDTSIDEFKIVTVFCKNNVLVASKVIDSSEMERNGSQFIYEIKNDFVNSAESMKIFMFDSLNNIYPLSKNIILE